MIVLQAEIVLRFSPGLDDLALFSFFFSPIWLYPYHLFPPFKYSHKCVGERALLRGSWTRQRVRDCLPEVRRYLVSRHRDKRLSQETEVQQWLLQQLARPQKGAAA